MAAAVWSVCDGQMDGWVDGWMNSFQPLRFFGARMALFSFRCWVVEWILPKLSVRERSGVDVGTVEGGGSSWC